MLKTQVMIAMLNPQMRLLHIIFNREFSKPICSEVEESWSMTALSMPHLLHGVFFPVIHFLQLWWSIAFSSTLCSDKFFVQPFTSCPFYLHSYSTNLSWPSLSLWQLADALFCCIKTTVKASLMNNAHVLISQIMAFFPWTVCDCDGFSVDQRDHIHLDDHVSQLWSRGNCSLLSLVATRRFGTASRNSRHFLG